MNKGYSYNKAANKGIIIANINTIAIMIVIILLVFVFLNIIFSFQCEVFMDYRNFGPVIFLCTVIIGFVIFYENKKANRKKAESKQHFWDRENQANSTRKKDISNLDYIIVPLDRLPMSPSKDDEVSEYQQIITNLSTKHILNLSDKTNTDLKLEYGVANLTILSDYDNNYTTLINTLARWGARLFQLEENTDAITILEYGIEIGTDISRNFILLAEYYSSMGRIDEIDRLIEKADNINSIMKPSIIKKLNACKETVS